RRWLDLVCEVPLSLVADDHAVGGPHVVHRRRAVVEHPPVRIEALTRFVESLVIEARDSAGEFKGRHPRSNISRASARNADSLQLRSSAGVQSLTCDQAQ